MKRSLKNWQGTLAVIGVDWGDSGKGRLIDDLATHANIVARFAGGSNTGHTVENQYGKFALHIVPSGIFNRKAKCLVGRNVAVDLESLASELQDLEKAGISHENLIIDAQASLTMPWHKLRDNLREKWRKNKVGTTGKGVGPTYADRTERVGLLVKDLISKEFKNKLREEINFQNKFYNMNLNFNKIHSQYEIYCEMIANKIGNTVSILDKAIRSNGNILFEGAQGYFLDIDAGTYPFVTSSNTGVVGISRSYDLHPSKIDQVIGITKAYTTRVGAGPMPTKMQKDTAQFIITKGREVGTTTGRVREPGWLDLVLIKAAAKANNVTALAVTKLDVLGGLKKIELCTTYKHASQKVQYNAHDAQFLAQVKPVYEHFAGWREDISQVREFTKLPINAKTYIHAIEKITKIPIKFISVGPRRGEVIYV